MKGQQMKKTFALLAIIAAFSAGAQTIGISSGQPTGTYYAITNDIIKVCSKPNARIINVPSDGSLDNIFKIYGDKTTQYGIVQTDALVYEQGIDPKMMSRIMMVFPFYSEEFHLLVKDDSSITSIDELAGKKVVEGVEGSGNWVTAQVIKKVTGIKWIPVAGMTQQQGYDAVVNGTADAELVVAGKPVSMITKSHGIKLVPISNPALDSFGLYTKTMIPSGTYAFQKSSIRTYKVDSILATFAFKNQYQKEIGDLVSCIAGNVGMMQTAPGFHVKWREVDPLGRIDKISWPAHPAATAAIKRELSRGVRRRHNDRGRKN